MTFDICYCFPAGDEHVPYGHRFLTTYFQNPPNMQHSTVILTDPGNE